MKSLVIYLTSFFIIASFIRAQLGIHDKNDRFFKLPGLEEKLKSKDKNSSKVAKAQIRQVKLLKKPEPIIKFASLFDTKLKPIEYKYLKYGFKKALSKKWYSTNARGVRFTLNVKIDKKILDTQKFVTLKDGKRFYKIYQKCKIKIYYKLFSDNGKLVLKSTIPYNVIVKAGSHWDFLESERLAKKKLFTQIGIKLANDLNRRYNYIMHSLKSRK